MGSFKVCFWLSDAIKFCLFRTGLCAKSKSSQPYRRQCQCRCLHIDRWSFCRFEWRQHWGFSIPGTSSRSMGISQQRGYSTWHCHIAQRSEWSCWYSGETALNAHWPPNRKWKRVDARSYGLWFYWTRSLRRLWCRWLRTYPSIPNS